jgi:RNA binding exosome subunit
MNYDYDYFLKIYSENKDYIQQYNEKLCEIVMRHIGVKDVTKELLDIIMEIDCSCNFYLKFTKKVIMEKVDLMELHFSYSMEGKGFNDAKQDFFNRII